MKMKRTALSYNNHGDMIYVLRKDTKHPVGLQTKTVQRSKHFSSVHIINLFTAQQSSFKDAMFKMCIYGEIVDTMCMCKCLWS